MANTYHTPVMAAEVLEALAPQAGQTVVDATLGGAGHAALIAERVGRAGLLIGIDQDADAIAEATRRLESIPQGQRPRLLLIQARFDRIKDSLAEHGVGAVSGALFDLGVSSHQLDEPARGFSFKAPAMPLDMRMNADDSSAPTAADLLNTLDEREMTRVFRDYADERWAARIAKFVAERRARERYETVGQLTDTINAAVPAAARAKDSIHPATRVFQALRIAVNDEYDVLAKALDQAVALLDDEGRIAVISYHSGEDRIVKRLFARRSGHCECPPAQPVCSCGAAQPSLTLITKRPLVPSAAEVAQNPRARSAKLRVAARRSGAPA